MPDWLKTRSPRGTLLNLALLTIGLFFAFFVIIGRAKSRNHYSYIPV